MSMFASSADYWKFRAELAETTVRETAEALGCEPDNEVMLDAAQGAARYRWLAREHGWLLLKHFPAVRPYVDAIEVIDESIDAAMLAARGIDAAERRR